MNILTATRLTAVRLTTTRLTAALLLTLAGAHANAAVMNYTYAGALDSGDAIGEMFNGAFAFDDSSLTNTGDEYLTLDGFSLNFMSLTFTDADGLPEAHFVDGAFVGVDFNAVFGNNGLALISGFSDLNEAFFAFEPEAPALAGFGSVTYTLQAAQVPEPGSIALVLAGLGLLGASLRRSK